MILPAETDRDVRRLVQLNAAMIRSTLDKLTVPSPAYAVGLWGSDPDLLAPTVVCVGLDETRRSIIGTSNRDEAREQVWNVADFAIDGEPNPHPRSAPSFVAAEDRARATLESRGIWDPAGFILNQVARLIGEAPPKFPRTDDFVVFAFDEDFDLQLRQNIEYSSTDEALLKLEAKGLLPGPTNDEEEDAATE